MTELSFQVPARSQKSEVQLKPTCRFSGRGRRSQHHGEQCGGFVVTTNPVDTVKSNHNVAGLCSPLEEGHSSRALPGVDKEGQSGDTALEA